MPSADFRELIRKPHGLLSPVAGTARGSPEVSSTAFATHPPDLQNRLLMDMDFAIHRSLVQTDLPRIRFLFIESWLC